MDIIITYDDGVEEPVPLEAGDGAITVSDLSAALRMVADAQEELGEDYVVTQIELR